MKRTLTCLLLAVATAASAQVPGTDIYLLPLGDGAIPGSSALVNATARPGYDNQPRFLADASGIRYSSIDATGQADIWLYDLASGQRRNLTGNPTSEYSATPMPGGDRFSVVRVEPDSTQRLWSFAPDGSDPRLHFEDLAPVGYHAWGREGEIALFILGTPHALHRARTGTPGSTRVVGDIGRCLQAIPGEDAWSFPLANAEAGWVITRLDRVSGELRPIAAAPSPEVQDYCWTPDGRLWSSDGSALLEWRGGEWKRLRDFAPEGISGITRMDVSPDGRWLAFVAADVARAELTIERMEEDGGIGAVVADYLRAFNAEDEPGLRAWLGRHRDATSLERTPLDQRVSRQLQLRGMLGALTPVQARQPDEASYDLVVYAEAPGSWFLLTFVASEFDPVRFGSMGVSPTGEPGNELPALSGRLEDVVAMVRENRGLPALAVAVVGPDGVETVAVDGVRSIDGSDPVQPADRFHYGSITKSVTSCIAARLVDRGVITYDTTLEEGLDGVWIHPDFKAVTLRQLLQHRAGVEALLEGQPEREARWARAEGPTQQRRALVAELVSVEPEFEPGSAMSYSNGAYVVAALMLEQAGGSSWEDLVQSEVSGPLGLESWGLGWPATELRPDQPRGHWPGPVLQDFGGYELGSFIDPAGDVHGNVLDLARYGHALATGPDGWIRPRTLEAMLAAAGDDPASGYAMGIVRETVAGRAVALHNGSAGTFFAMLVFDPASGESVAVVMNEGDFANDAVARAIAVAILDGSVRP